MISNKHLQVAYRLAAVFLVIGCLSYAAFPAKPPESPVRMVYKTNAGKVLFDHKTHLADRGYGLACIDCHHHPMDEETETTISCGACHTKPEQSEMAAQTCNECHEPDDYDLDDMTVRADAFHDQCIACHKEFGAGPQECSACHVI